MTYTKETGRYPIVFFSKMAQAVPALGPVNQECGGIFVSNRSETLRFFKRNYPNMPALHYRNCFGPFSVAHRALSSAKVIVSGGGHRSVLEKFPVPCAMVFHGTYRALGPEDVKKLTHFDHMFLVGPRMERMLLRCTSELQFSTTGYIPFSVFPPSTPENRAHFLRKLGLDSERPTVLYAPARRDCGSWLDCAESIAREISPRFNLVMRPHPNQALHGTRRERILYRRVARILKDRGNAVIDLAVCSFSELLCSADVLIGDATSPNEEFMFYDRPQIITETYAREKWLEQYRTSGIHPDDVEELMSLYDCAYSYTRGGFRNWDEAVQHAYSNQNDHAGQRRHYFQSAFGKNPSGAAKRTADALQQMIIEKGRLRGMF